MKRVTLLVVREMIAMEYGGWNEFWRLRNFRTAFMRGICFLYLGERGREAKRRKTYVVKMLKSGKLHRRIDRDQ